MVYPFGWRLVAPLVLTGVDTLLLMSKNEAGEESYINPHGDLKWITFGRDDLDYR
jgi:hypothetical protein